MSFISNMVRNWLPSYASRATLRKEICSIGSAHEKQVVAQKNPFVISPVTQMCKNRLPLNITLTTVVAWRLPAELWGIPTVICSLAGLMSFIPTDDVYLPVRPIRNRPLNQKSNVRLPWRVSASEVARCIGVSRAVLYKWKDKIIGNSAYQTMRKHNKPSLETERRTRCVAGGSRPTEPGNTPPADGAGYSEKGEGNQKKSMVAPVFAALIFN